MKRLAIITVSLLMPLLVLAETKAQSMVWNHELRIGWGDQLFESLVWHNPTTVIKSLSPELRFVNEENFRYRQHLWAEYQYSASHWFSVGMKLDMSEVSWVLVTRDGQGQVVSTDNGHYFYNVEIMPVMRFTYFRLDWVNLFLSLGGGLAINGGTEPGPKGNKTVFGWAADVTLLGATFNYKRAFIGLEYGGIYAMQSTNNIFLLKSAMFRASIGVRF